MRMGAGDVCGKHRGQPIRVGLEERKKSAMIASRTLWDRLSLHRRQRHYRELLRDSVQSPVYVAGCGK